VYVFKKALFLLHALVLRFTPSDPATASVGEKPVIPLPDTSAIPVFSDNVLPSMLVHLGVLDVSQSTYTAHRSAFAKKADVDAEEGNLAYTLRTVVQVQGARGQGSSSGGSLTLADLEEGPVLNEEEAYALRAAAVDACELLVETAKDLDLGDHHLEADKWVKNLTLPELDGWLWAVAKEGRFRSLARFAQPGTVMY
jgi:hypothetical protein